MTQPLTAAQSRLVTENLGLVHACANRFRGRGAEYEDLYQAGCLGLVKAARGFDESLGFRFSTYAVPAILGEIRRIFRDGGSVKLGRSAKEKARALLAARAALLERSGEEPGVRAVAEAAGMDPAEAAALLSACLPPVSLTGGEDDAELDLPEADPAPALAQTVDLQTALARLDATDRALIELRYFRGQTQSAAAEQLGMTQVQVSRREKKILLRLRGELG